MRAGPLLACALLLAAACGPAPAAALKVPCATSTGIASCIECLPAAVAGSRDRCYWCAPLTSAGRWDAVSGNVVACVTTNTTCALRGPKDANCLRCDGIYCTRCKPGFGLNSLGKCLNLTSSPISVCRSASGNAECAACNPDGSCARCSGAKLVLPLNAVFLDSGYPATQCNTSAGVNAEARNITTEAAWLPPNCTEVDSDFRCASCKPGTGPVRITNSTDIKCVVNPARTPGRYPSGCLTQLPYMQYCTSCSSRYNGTRCADGACTGSRTADAAGLCSNNCKGFFGIACKKCTATACTLLDPALNYRRRR